MSIPKREVWVQAEQVGRQVPRLRVSTGHRLKFNLGEKSYFLSNIRSKGGKDTSDSSSSEEQCERPGTIASYHFSRLGRVQYHPYHPGDQRLGNTYK